MSAAAVEAAVPRERGILFSPAMVRAILAGKKTQTRRLVKEQPASAATGLYADRYNRSDRWAFWLPDNRMDSPRTFACPQGDVGDRLWVREGWRPSIAHHCGQDACDCAAVNVHYLADKSMRFFPEADIPDAWNMPKAAQRGRSVTSLYMPRWASRLILEITNVRVQRLNDISEEDAKAEGVEPTVTQESWSCMRKDGTAFDIFVAPTPEWPGADLVASVHVPAERISTARENFARLWDSLNAERAPWSSSPWVWCISFRRVEAPR